uniref:uncharacterized protein LOC120809584 isoform X2 n=1 Tax=Gasterosteus aculeatus aculeatus TaxID=481459 RepID=UPI001A986846|nr:uncharacterized protein LOC120809584 isoform X2 [Gasterosteus aculeatus aculeatus]
MYECIVNDADAFQWRTQLFNCENRKLCRNARESDSAAHRGSCVRLGNTRVPPRKTPDRRRLLGEETCLSCSAGALSRGDAGKAPGASAQRARIRRRHSGLPLSRRAAPRASAEGERAHSDSDATGRQPLDAREEEEEEEEDAGTPAGRGLPRSREPDSGSRIPQRHTNQPAHALSHQNLRTSRRRPPRSPFLGTTSSPDEPSA